MEAKNAHVSVDASEWVDSSSESSHVGVLDHRLLPTTPFQTSTSASTPASPPTFVSPLALKADIFPKSYAFVDSAGIPSATKRTNLGNTRQVMAILSEMWFFNLVFILAGVYLMTFYLGKLQGYDDYVMFNYGILWKLGIHIYYKQILLFDN